MHQRAVTQQILAGDSAAHPPDEAFDAWSADRLVGGRTQPGTARRAGGGTGGRSADAGGAAGSCARWPKLGAHPRYFPLLRDRVNPSRCGMSLGRRQAQAAGGDAEPSRRRGGAAGLVAWCTYDWANSAFPTVIVTFVFAAYFAKAVAADEITGTSQWSFAISISMLVTALLSPLLGAIADHAWQAQAVGGRIHVLMVVATALSVVCPAESGRRLLDSALFRPRQLCLRNGNGLLQRHAAGDCAAINDRPDFRLGMGIGIRRRAGLPRCRPAAADPARSAAVRPRRGMLPSRLEPRRCWLPAGWPCSPCRFFC